MSPHQKVSPHDVHSPTGLINGDEGASKYPSVHKTAREKLADPSDVDARSSVPQRGHATMMGANPGSRAEEESDLDHLGICA